MRYPLAIFTSLPFFFSSLHISTFKMKTMSMGSAAQGASSLPVYSSLEGRKRKSYTKWFVLLLVGLFFILVVLFQQHNKTVITLDDETEKEKEMVQVGLIIV